MKKFLKALGMCVLGGLIVEGVCQGLDHLAQGKDFFGHERIREDTKMDWKGNIHLGTEDYQIV